MGQIYLFTNLSILAVSLLSFVGAFTLAIKPDQLKKITMYLVSLSAGTLLGDSFLHLLPEAAEGSSGLGVWLGALLGIVIFFVLEKIVHWRHCHIPTSDAHPHPVGIMNLVGDGLHNFFDGVVIAGSFLVNPYLGLTTTLAVIAHEIPQEIGDFGVLIHAGYARSRALRLNFLIALASFAGAWLTLIFGGLINDFSKLIIPFTAGGFIYIATADLLPELKRDCSFRAAIIQLSTIILGIIIMLGLKYCLE